MNSVWVDPLTETKNHKIILLKQGELFLGKVTFLLLFGEQASEHVVDDSHCWRCASKYNFEINTFKQNMVSLFANHRNSSKVASQILFQPPVNLFLKK